MKECNAWDLHNELIAADFKIHGVSFAKGDNIVTIHLTDEETKDPYELVKDHVFIAPKTNKEILTEEKTNYSNATASEKLTIIAKRLNLI